jgi:cell division protein FtsZ
MIKETDKTQTPLVDFGEPVDMSKNIIKVVGVGGGGCNAVNNMYRSRINNVTFAVCNTDSQSLANSPVPVKLLLGSAGLGAGANPEIGRKEAEENLEGIKNLFNDGTRMVFVTAGMGGGTGTGAAPVVAGVAKSLGLLTVGIVTIPFYFEKKMKIVKALKGVEEMRKNVDALLIINNERLCDVYSDSPISVKDAFKRADDILDTAARSISELITIEGEMNLDFRDVEATMRGGGGAIMAMGRASGEKRVQAAVTNALESPLLYGRDITKAKRILFNIYTGEEAPLFVNEMNEIDAFMDSLDPNIEVIWGLSNDNTIGTDAKVTILATGLGDGWNDEAVNASIVNSDEYYDEIISKLYSRSKRNAQPVEIEEPKTEEVQEPHEDVSMPESDPVYDDEEEEPEDKPLPKVPNPVLEKLKLMVLKFFNE